MAPALNSLTQHFLSERPRWPLWLPAILAAGILTYFALPTEPPAAILALPPALALAAWCLRLRHWPAAIILFAVTIFTLGLAAGMIDTRLTARPMLNTTYGPAPISGRAILTEIMPDGIRLTLLRPRITGVGAQDNPAKIRIKLRGKTLADVPPPGADISLYGSVGPFSEPVTPGGMDFRRQAFFRQLGGLGWSYGQIKILEADPPPLSWQESLGLCFERARQKLARHVYNNLTSDTAAMTATRLNGEQTAISQPVIDAMRTAGLAHLLSTSGFHVTIMGLLIYFPLRAALALIPFIALRYPVKKWAAFAALLSATGYSLLVGAQPATLRSLIMTSLALIAILIDRRADPLRLVLLSASLGLLLVPDAILSPGFQMSFAAVFALIALGRRDWGWLGGDFAGFAPRWLTSITGHMIGILRTSLIATAATTPFVLYHFQSFSLYGFAANLAAIPLTSFWVMPAIIMAYLTAPFGLDGWFIRIAGHGTDVTIKVAETVASWPHARFAWPAMPAPVLIAITLGGLWLCIWRIRWRWLGLLPILIGMAYPLYITLPDLFIAPDGKEWAVRLSNGDLAVSNLRHDKFASQQWAERLGNTPLIAAEDATDPTLHCTDDQCTYTRVGHSIALPLDKSADLTQCPATDFALALSILPDCLTPHWIDAALLHKHGAIALYLDHAVPRVSTAHKLPAARPWQEGWK